MPEIENIALREALKDFGLEVIRPGDDVVLHVEHGPKGLFVSKAEKNSPLESRHDRLEQIDALDADEGFAEICRGSPDKAVELAGASLARSARMMAEIVEDTRRDLIEIAVRRERIDRAQAETRDVLKRLIEDAPQ
jgi:hypothetical protein